MLELKYDVFLKVSETGNFSRAAEEMNLTASAVSHIIAKLEREFGFSLFIRSRSGVVLTESGKRILAHLRSISAQYRLLEKEAAQIRDCAVGRVRIGTYYSVTVNWLAPLLPELCTRRRIADVRVFPLLPAAYRTIGIGVRDKKMLDPASRVIYDEIVQFVRAQVGK